MTVTGSFRTLALATAALLVYGCGDAAGPEPAPVAGTIAATAIEASGTVGQPTQTSPSVTVKDTKGRAMSGATVTFSVVTGGGSVSQASAVTNASGVANAGVWTLGTQAGANVLQATVAALAPVTFTVNAAADVPASLATLTTNPANGTVGQNVTPGVVVKDRFANPVAGVTVTFTPGANSGTVSGATAVTNAAGVATVAGWTLGTTAGVQTLQATVGALNASMSVLAGAAAAATMQAVTAATQSGTAGVVVGTVPSVRVLDAFGNAVAGATVTFEVTSGAGSVTGATATTNAQGLAALGSWTLGTVAGANSVRASVTGVAPVTFNATGSAGAAAKLEKVSGDAQSAVVESELATAPSVRVRDAFDNLVSGATVTFSALNGGSIAGSPAVTDGSGVATAGKWKLGPNAGTQQLEATVGAIKVSFSATANPKPSNPPASAQAASSVTQNGTVGAAVASRPAVIVRDAQSNPVSGVTVTFAVTSGGGSLAGATAVTGATGIATVGSWTLGTVPGTNTLSANVTGLGAVTFTATAAAGPAATVAISAGDFQTTTVGAAVPVAPAVLVRDAFGNAVSGASVTFAIASGGGFVSGGVKTTNASGVATAGGWVMGSNAGENTMSATVGGVAPVTFRATALGVPAGAFNIEVRYVGTVDASIQAAVTAAVARWTDVIRGDVQNVSTGAVPANACGITHPAYNEVVDDLLIFAEFVAIDGVGQVLGAAGPCQTRGNSNIPAVGVMKFDVADMANMQANGSLQDVILHEIGHILGIGTIWEDRFLLTGAGGADPFFSGVSSLVYFGIAGGTVAAGNGVPVENTGQAGTRDSHWRESVFQDELMTGWISGSVRPMSAVTIASLADLGYTVNFAAADAFTLPPGTLLMRARAADAVELVELPLPRPRRIW